MKILLFAIVILISTASFSQSISGKVVDSETGEPLVGASVYIVNTFKGKVTDSKGKFKFEDLGQGIHEFRAAYIGYKTAVDSFEIKGTPAGYISFKLEPEYKLQKEVLVTGSQVSSLRSSISLTSSVITRSELEQSGEINLMPLISNKVPGVFVTQRGVLGFGVSDGAAGQISIRGIGSGSQAQVLVLIDGQPQAMGIFGHAFSDMYKTSDVEKVEVIRGPASFLYGSNAMGGVINLITNKNKTSGYSASVQETFGTFNTWVNTISAGYGGSRFSVNASYNHDKTDGHRSNSRYKGDNSFLNIAVPITSNVKLNLAGNYSVSHSTDPGSIYANASDYDNNSHWAKVNRGNAMMTVTNEFEKYSGHLKLFYNQGNHSIFDGWNSVDINYGVTVFEAIKLFKNNMIGVGFDYNQYGGKGSPITSAVDENGTMKIVPSALNDSWIDVSEKAAYTFVQHKFFEKIVVNAGGRFQNHSLYGNQFIPEIGVNYQLNKQHKFKALVSKGYRSPTIRELYFFPPANDQLKPEELWNYEIGYTRNAMKDRLTTSIETFYNKGSNLISTIKPGLIPINMNTGKFEHYGAELEADFKIKPNFVVNASYAYLHTNSPKVAAPTHQANIGAMYIFRRVDINVFGKAISGLHSRVDNQFTPANEDVIENYFILNSKINIRATRNLSIYITGENLLDSNYQIIYGYPMPGRTIMGGITIRLN